MTAHRFLNIVMSIGLVAAMALVLGGSHLLDGEPPYSAAQADAIKQLQAERKREMAARELCAAEYGPQAAHHWDAEGSLVCISKRGEVLRTAGL
jgi:hypothetical protein